MTPGDLILLAALVVAIIGARYLLRKLFKEMVK